MQRLFGANEAAARGGLPSDFCFCLSDLPGGLLCARAASRHRIAASEVFKAKKMRGLCM